MSKRNVASCHTESAYSGVVDLLKHAQAFVAVADEESFTGGAEACGLPQPVLSRRVATLERLLGGRLLERGPRGARLTPLGRHLLPYSRDLVARGEYLTEAARAYLLDDVRAAFPDYADPRRLADLRRQLGAAGVHLVFDEVPPDRRESELAEGRLQLALTPAPIDRAHLRVPLGAATAGRHPRGQRVHLSALRADPGSAQPPPRLLILPEEDVPHVRDVLVQDAYSAGLGRDQVLVGVVTAEALTAVHERGDVLVCAEVEAARHELLFRELVPQVARGYRLRYREDHPSGRVLAEALPATVQLVAAALGGQVIDR